MALVGIIIKDVGDNDVEVDVRSDAPMDEDTELTLAQGIALATTTFIASMLGGDVEEMPEEEKPSLEVVGEVD